MSTPWNETTEKALLIGMLECPEESYRAKYEAAAARLGKGFNANQCRQKFYKLKKESEKLLSGDGIGAPAETSTPKKTTKTNKTNGATTTPASKRKKKANAIDDDAATTPSKKIKQEAEAEESEREETDGAEVKAEVDGA